MHTHNTQEIRKGYLEFCRPLNWLLICIISICESPRCYLAYLPGFSSERKVGLQFLALPARCGPVICCGRLREQECCASLPERSFKSQCVNCHSLFFFSLCHTDQQCFSWWFFYQTGFLEIGQCRRENGQAHGQEIHLVFLNYWDLGVTCHHSSTSPLWLTDKPQKSHGLLRNSHVYTAYLGTDSQRPTLYLCSLFEQDRWKCPVMQEPAHTPAGSHTSELLCKTCPKLLT